MSKKKKNRNVTSIAIKINSISVRNLFFKFLLIDLCFALIITGHWCINAEKNFYGSFQWDAERNLSFNPIEESKYTVVWNDGEIMTKDAYDFLYGLRRTMILVGIIESLLLLEQAAFGTSKIRKQLSPLKEIAETAERISNMDFDAEKFHTLEDAISKISPEMSGERINIGDSDLKGLEDAVNKLLDRMRESYRQQARFVSDASHELRTPISVIQGYANMLDRWGKNDRDVLDESIAAIKSESENMKNLVEQLLFLARGINGKNQLSIKEFQLEDMMKEVFEESGMIDVKHEYRYVENESAIVMADEGLLKQAARILIENASKYTEDGGEIVLRSGVNDKGEPYFSVQDSGIGIGEHDVPHVFERFFRADTARERKTGGTGLGLPIAKWIVDSHRGKLSVLSRKGIGTRITVYLPSHNV